MEIILILIVAISLIALIRVSKKRKALEKSLEESSDKRDTPVLPDTEKKTEITSGPSQINIYELSSKAGTRLCPFCDGENRAGVRVCDICGRDI